MGNSFNKLKWNRWYDKSRRKILLMSFDKTTNNNFKSFLCKGKIEESKEKNVISNTEVKYNELTFRIWVRNNLN